MSKLDQHTLKVRWHADVHHSDPRILWISKANKVKLATAKVMEPVERSFIIQDSSSQLSDPRPTAPDAKLQFEDCNDMHFVKE